MPEKSNFYRNILILAAGIITVTPVTAQVPGGFHIMEIQGFHSITIALFILLIFSFFLILYLINKIRKNNAQPDKHLTDGTDPENQLIFTLIDYIPDRIYIKDRKSRFIAGNRHVANIMGVSTGRELIGKTDFDFYAKDLADEYFRDEQLIMKSGESIINKEERGLDLDGNEIIVSTTKVPFKNNHGKIIGIIGIGRDITLQKLNEGKLLKQQRNLLEANTLLEERQEEIQQQAEELHTQSEFLIQVNQELEKLSLVASHTDNVIIIMDAEANIEWGNHRFEEFYGMSMDEFRKNYTPNLRKVSANPDINSILDSVIQTRKAASYEALARDHDGSETWMQTTISPVLDERGNIIKLIAIDSNITKIKTAEEEINLQKSEIEKNRDELNKLNATKDKFFSIIAHDLKNPFHSIMGFSDLLTRSYDAIDEERKKEFLGLIKESSTAAYKLLENLLDWSRTQTNVIKFTPANINLSDILYDNVQIHSVNAQNKEIAINYDLPVDIITCADANMVNTIVRNLISNALKFTPGGGQIMVKAWEAPDRVNVSVSDTGIGMDEQAKRKLFRIDEFHNTAGTAGETGTGLGLIICREFVAKHGFDIHVESEPGKGSTFSFSLPLKQ
jgi:PAS domain S-box-containing protein